MNYLPTTTVKVKPLSIPRKIKLSQNKHLISFRNPGIHLIQTNNSQLNNTLKT
jgi:hypothetical protein